jgi:hypothetical protein
MNIPLSLHRLTKKQFLKIILRNYCSRRWWIYVVFLFALIVWYNTSFAYFSFFRLIGVALILPVAQIGYSGGSPRQKRMPSFSKNVQ